MNSPPSPKPPSAPRAGTVPSLDAQALGRLRELDPDGRQGVVPRVLAAFETSLARMLTQLQVEADDPDPAVVASIAHMLKSSSASVGALALASTCADVERRIRTGDLSCVQRDIGRLISDGEAAQQAVGAILRP
ncbi:MAG: Hpt domain-containing protein [Rubrivivax sp.]|nr:Hpt domain-containing protein [Rubrivivax sp.]MDP3613561.1 Hpt domain-containing protein [Rubrivivax sp.]